MERVGEGEAIHREERWRKCLHSTFRYTTQGREVVNVWFSYFIQSAEYFYCRGFMARVRHERLCAPRTPSYLHIISTRAHTWGLLFTCLCKSELHATHISEHAFMSVFHTKKSCILIRSQWACRESNPPGCDFPPLVLWGWGDWDCLGQLSLLRWGNNATVSSPLLASSCRLLPSL